MGVCESIHTVTLAANLIYSQGGLSQQTLDNIASLAWQLSSSPALGESLQAMREAELACRRAYIIPVQWTLAWQHATRQDASSGASVYVCTRNMLLEM